MDPTGEFTRLRPLGASPLRFTPKMLPDPFIHDENIQDNINSILNIIKGEFNDVYVDKDLYDESRLIKKQYSQIDQRKFSEYRDKVNPYENLKSGSFMNRASIKLANIDALYRVTGHFNGLLEEKITDRNFTYASIAEGPGGFVQYIQFRSPMSVGYGITLQQEKQKAFNWNMTELDMLRFNVDYAGRVKGDITTEWKLFCDDVIKRSGSVNLVTADGGTDITSEEEYDMEEAINSRLIFTEVLMSLILIRGRENTDPSDIRVTHGGTLVLKVYDTVTQISADILYVLTRCFRSVSIFKPVSSRPANSEKYIICQDKHTDLVVGPWIDLMKKVELEYRNNEANISGFINLSILGEEYTLFTEWLMGMNNELTLIMNNTGNKILALSRGEDIVNVKIDLPLCFTLWNLSSTESKPCPMRLVNGKKPIKSRMRK